EEGGTYSPLSSAKAVDNILTKLDQAKAAGATIHTGGQREDLHGYYVQPTVITDIPQGSDVYYEEFFGPVVSIFKVNSDDEALQVGSDTQYRQGTAVIANH